MFLNGLASRTTCMVSIVYRTLSCAQFFRYLDERPSLQWLSPQHPESGDPVSLAPSRDGSRQRRSRCRSRQRPPSDLQEMLQTSVFASDIQIAWDYGSASSELFHFRNILGRAPGFRSTEEQLAERNRRNEYLGCLTQIGQHRLISLQKGDDYVGIEQKSTIHRCQPARTLPRSLGSSAVPKESPEMTRIGATPNRSRPREHRRITI